MSSNYTDNGSDTSYKLTRSSPSFLFFSNFIEVKICCFFFITESRFEFWFVGYQRFVCADLGVTTGIMQQCYAKSELAKVIGIEFADQLFYHSNKMQELNLTIDDIAVLRSFLVFSPGR